MYPAAESGGRPARNAPRHSNAKSMVSMETVFNFIPRTGFFTGGTIWSFETGAIARERAADVFLRTFVAGIIDLTFLNQIEAAANARLAAGATPGAGQDHICGAVCRSARKFPCDKFQAHLRSRGTIRDTAGKASGISRRGTSSLISTTPASGTPRPPRSIAHRHRERLAPAHPNPPRGPSSPEVSASRSRRPQFPHRAICARHRAADQVSARAVRAASPAECAWS